MKIMESCMTLDDLEATKTGIYLIYSSGIKDTNNFTYWNPFGIHFKYKHKLYGQKKHRHTPISLESTWATKFWPDHKFAWYLDVSEGRTDFASGHFQNDGVLQPNMDFWRELVLE